MVVAWAAGGMGLGTMWGQEQAWKLLKATGFSSMRS
jgi:hypothetical protein